MGRKAVTLKLIQQEMFVTTTVGIWLATFIRQRLVSTSSPLQRMTTPSCGCRQTVIQPKVQITQESTWQGVRNFQPAGDETTSSPVFLEKGKTYFIECFAKEGGGGDNMAVAWSLPSDEGVEAEAGALPISGEFLSPFVSTIDPEPTPLLTGNSPKGAFAIGEGGDIEVTFLNRGLDLVDVSVTVNGAKWHLWVARFLPLLHHLETLRVQLKLQSLTMEKRSNGPIDI